MQAVPNAASSSASDNVSAYATTPVGVSFDDFVPNDGPDHTSDRSIPRHTILHDTTCEEAAEYRVWHRTSGHSNLGICGTTFDRTPESSFPINTSAQNAFDQNQLDQIFNETGLERTIYDNFPPETADDQATANDVFYAEDYPTWH